MSKDATGTYSAPQEAWNIDKKLDDGKPFTGSVWVMDPYMFDCDTNNSGWPIAPDGTAQYSLDIDENHCALVLKAD